MEERRFNEEEKSWRMVEVRETASGQRECARRHEGLDITNVRGK